MAVQPFIFEKTTNNWMLKIAASIQEERLPVNGQKLPRFQRLIHEWLPGNIHLVESDDIKQVNQDMHCVIADACMGNWKVTIIDAANSFNPYLLDRYTENEDTTTILKKILLARPFQTQQHVSLIDQAYRQIRHNRQLVLATSFFQPFRQALKENAEENITVDLMQSVRLLQKVAVKGATVIVTDKISASNPLIPFSKVHLQFRNLGSNIWLDQLLAHPFLPPNQYRHVEQQVKKSLSQQLTLHDFF